MEKSFNSSISLNFWVLIVFTVFNSVSAHYCEFEFCQQGQYCCGDNLCCQYVYSLWYFWVGIVFVLLLVSACIGIFRYHWRHRKSSGGILYSHNCDVGSSYSKMGSSHGATGASKPLSSHSQYHYQVMTDT